MARNTGTQRQAHADIEKENLEAHVELCSERYKQLHDKFDAINSRLDRHEETLSEIHKAVTTNETNRNRQVMAWGAAIIASLAGAIAYLVSQSL
jgi:chromosome segregation ATPase